MRIFKINEVGNLNTRDNNNFYGCDMHFILCKIYLNVIKYHKFTLFESFNKMFIYFIHVLIVCVSLDTRNFVSVINLINYNC